MKPLEVIDLGSFEFEMNNGSVKVPVKLTAEIYPDDIEDLSWCDAKDLAEIESGALCGYSIVVKAKALNLEGFDSLGGTFVCNMEGIKSTIQDHGMEDNAIADLKQNVLAQIEILKPFMEGQ